MLRNQSRTVSNILPEEHYYTTEFSFNVHITQAKVTANQCFFHYPVSSFLGKISKHYPNDYLSDNVCRGKGLGDIKIKP